MRDQPAAAEGGLEETEQKTATFKDTAAEKTTVNYLRSSKGIGEKTA